MTVNIDSCPHPRLPIIPLQAFTQSQLTLTWPLNSELFASPGKFGGSLTKPKPKPSDMGGVLARTRLGGRATAQARGLPALVEPPGDLDRGQHKHPKLEEPTVTTKTTPQSPCPKLTAFQRALYLHICTSPWATYPPPPNGMVPPLPRIIRILGMMLAMLGMLSSTVRALQLRSQTPFYPVNQHPRTSRNILP